MKKWIFICVGVLLLPFTGLLAQSKTDSLHQALEEHPVIDSAYIELLNKLAYAYKRVKPDSMLFWGKRMVHLSDSIGYGTGLSNGNRIIGSYYVDQHELPQAISHSEEALRIADSLHLPFPKAKALNQLASLYVNVDQLDKGVPAILEAISLFKQEKQRFWEAVANQTLGNIYRVMADWDKSVEAHTRALKIFESENIDQVAGQSLNLGGTYRLMGEVQVDTALRMRYFELGRSYLEQGLQAFEQKQDSFGAAIAAVNLGHLLGMMDQQYQALAAYDLGIRYNTLVGHQSVDYQAKWGKIEMVRRLGQYEEAKRLGLKLLEEKQGTLYGSELSDIYQTLHLCAIALEEYQEGYEFLLLKIDAEEKTEWNSQLKAEQREITSQFESEIQQSELALLEEKEETIRSFQLFLIAFLLVVLLAGTIWLRQAVLIRKQQRNIQAARKASLATETALAEAKLQRAAQEQRQLEETYETKNQLLTSQALQLAKKSEWLLQFQKQVSQHLPHQQLQKLIQTGLNQDQNWEEIRLLFEELHPSFFPALTQQFPDLTRSELRLAALYRMGLPKEKILDLLAISPESLKMARYRLRKKLQLESLDQLQEFLHTY